MPDEVDAMPVAWSAGWLLERMLEFEGDPAKWNHQPIGWGLDDPEYDPAFDVPAEPPPGWERLPMIGEVVGDGE